MSREGALGLAGAEARGEVLVLLLLKLSECLRWAMLSRVAAAKPELVRWAGCRKPATMPPWLDLGMSLRTPNTCHSCAAHSAGRMVAFAGLAILNPELRMPQPATK